MTLNPQEQIATVGDPRDWERGTVSGDGQPSGASHRKLLVLLGVGLIAALATARCLTPNPNGFGTHEQLGMSSCTFAYVFGVPCPSCGMTTSWAHLTRGALVQAARCNIGGLVTGLTAMIVGPWALVSGIRGRWLFGQPRLRYVLMLAIATYLAIVGQWLLRLWNP